jgi:hypothetical protein
MNLKNFHISGETSYQNLSFFGGYEKEEHGNFGDDILTKQSMVIANPYGPPLPIVLTQSSGRDYLIFQMILCLVISSTCNRLAKVQVYTFEPISIDTRKTRPY